MAVRSLRRPRLRPAAGLGAGLELARVLVEEHGEDSLTPFMLRPDKAFEFGEGALLAYRMVGETAVVSGDPVGPPAPAVDALGRFLRRCRRAGVEVVIYGASERHLQAYREHGLHVLCAGEEAIVDPATFSLSGRPVRKLRQSVHRVGRRGWRAAVYEGREIGPALEQEIDDLEALWRSQRGRILGFAMSMGEFDLGIRPHDLYVLAWSPEGRLQAVMRFLAYGEGLSLDRMRRIGATPNGLNEALVCHALEFARDRGIPQVSLNYAGLAHLVRHPEAGNRLTRCLRGWLLLGLGTRFQMDRLVQFNQKFGPTWRRRYLVYDSHLALPRSIFRVLQAEGYVSRPGQ